MSSGSGPWIRLTAALGAVTAAVATTAASPYGLGLLAAIAALGAAFPHHPFDAIYDLAIRPWFGGRTPEANGIPRRIACAVASVVLAAAGAAFGLGSPAGGYALGFSFVGAALVDFCVPSRAFGGVFGSPRRARSSAFLARTTSGC